MLDGWWFEGLWSGAPPTNLDQNAFVGFNVDGLVDDNVIRLQRWRHQWSRLEAASSIVVLNLGHSSSMSNSLHAGRGETCFLNHIPAVEEWSDLDVIVPLDNLQLVPIFTQWAGVAALTIGDMRGWDWVANREDIDMEWLIQAYRVWYIYPERDSYWGTDTKRKGDDKGREMHKKKQRERHTKRWRGRELYRGMYTRCVLSLALFCVWESGWERVTFEHANGAHPHSVHSWTPGLWMR